MKVHLLTQEQADQLTALNQPNILCVVCDYGSGLCIEENSIDDPVFASHKTLLDSFNIPLTEIEVPADIF